MVNFEALKELQLRQEKKLREIGINGPFEARGHWIFTDGYGAVVFTKPWEELAAWAAAQGWTVPKEDEKYKKMLTGFKPAKTYDVVVFKTTVEDFSTWLHLNTEACPVCRGGPSCPVTEKPDPEEDPYAVHYGWVGPAPVDRRRLVELLDIVQLPPDALITVTGFLKDERLTSSAPKWAGVRIAGKDCDIFLAGLVGAREGETRFHTDGKFLEIKVQHAK